MEARRSELPPITNPYDLLREEALRQSAKPPGGDPVIASLATAFLEEPEDSRFMQLVRATVDDRFERRDPARPKQESARERRKNEQAISPLKFNASGISEMFGMFRATASEFAMHAAPGEFSYEGFEQPSRWRQVFSELAEAVLDPNRDDTAAVQAEINLKGKKVQTTIPERYSVPELIAQTVRERFPDGVDWLDVGSGIMEGARQIVYKDKYPMVFTKVSEHTSTTPEDTDQDKVDELTIKANRLLALPSLVNRFVCVDIQSVYQQSENRYDPGAVEWAKASLRPSEYMDKGFMMKFNGLLEEEPDNIFFLQTDLLQESMRDTFLNAAPARSYDIISFVTMLHQLPIVSRLRMMHQAISMLKPNGLIIAQDFAYCAKPYAGHPISPSGLRMYSDWFRTPYRYNTFVYDAAHQEKGFQMAFQSHDSRCRQIALGAGSLMVNGELQSVRKLIEGD